MIEERLSCYFSGLIDMSCSCSQEIRPSHIKVNVFKIKDYKEKFSKYYEVPIESIKLTKINITINELFKNLLGKNNNLISSLLYYIEHDIGLPKEIYKVKDSSNLIDILSGYNNGVSGFYFVEDIYFIEYDKYIVSYIIGNNE